MLSPLLMTRKNIQEHVVGLRGIAIFLVVLFHLLPSYCRSGHLGVDVFFVMSGYFLFGSVGKHNFSLSEFYWKKVTRILPSLLIIILLLFPIAVFLYPASYKQSYAETGAAALLAISNEYLEYFTQGYFDFGSRENPLQHTWYLSVTLQMYVCVPLVALLFNRLSKPLRFCGWGILFILSFFAYHHGPAYQLHCPGVLQSVLSLPATIASFLPGEIFHSNASPYYWSVARVWEFMAGAAIAFMPALSEKKLRSALGLIGLFLIIAPAWVLSPGSLLNLPAVAGTMFLIRYGNSGITARLLTAPIIRGLGNISFSLYLCHWPIHTLYHYCTEQTEDVSAFAITGLLSLVVASLLWRYVESQRFTPHTTLSAWAILLALCACMTYAVKCGWHIPGEPKQVFPVGYHKTKVYEAGPLLQDLPEDCLPRHNWYGGGLYKNSDSDNHDESRILKMGSDGVQPSFVLAGDSHANALFPVISEEAAEIGGAGVFLRSYMTPLPGIDWHTDQEDEMIVTSRKIESFSCWLERHPEIRLVLLGQWWKVRLRRYEREHQGEEEAHHLACADFYEALAAFCKRMQKAGKQVAIINQVPVIQQPNFDICHYVNKQLLFRKEPDKHIISVSRPEYDQYAGDVNRILLQLEEQGLCTILHQETSLLESGQMCAYEQGKLMMRDCSHLTYEGARKALRGMKAQLQQLLRPMTAQ